MTKAPVILAVALLLSTLLAVGYQALGLNRLRLEKVNVVIEPPVTKEVTDKKLLSLADLAALNLMGNAYKPVAVAPVVNVEPISALKLVLIGTITKSDASKSSALIQDSNRVTKRYYVGEIIERGVVLNSVAVDWVVVKRDDMSEVLRYPQGVFVADAAPASPVPVPTMMATQPRVDVTDSSQQNNTEASKLPPPTGSRRLMNLRERLKQVPAKQQ